MRLKPILAVFILFCALLAGCAGQQVQGNGEGFWTTMTHEQKYTFFADIYKFYYDDYDANDDRTDLTPEEIKWMRAEKKVLEKFERLLAVYDSNAGNAAMLDFYEAEINGLIDQLRSELIKEQ